MNCVLKSLLLICFLASLAIAQDQQQQGQAQQTWRCPSIATQAACISFKQSKAELEYGEYVCFRENEDDQYFSIATSESSLAWSAYDANGAPKQSATANGIILAWVTNHGVEDGSLAPSFMVQGIWRAPRNPFFFQSRQQGESTTVNVNSNTIRIDETFTNIRKTKTRYQLTIDRTTDRFLETMKSDSGKFFTKGYGHCITGIQSK